MLLFVIFNWSIISKILFYNIDSSWAAEIETQIALISFLRADGLELCVKLSCKSHQSVPLGGLYTGHLRFFKFFTIPDRIFLFQSMNKLYRHRIHAFWCLQINNKLEPWIIVYILQQIAKPSQSSLHWQTPKYAWLRQTVYLHQQHRDLTYILYSP